MGIDWSQENVKEAADDVIQNFHVHGDSEGAFNLGNRLFRDAGAALGYRPEPRPVARYNCIYCGFLGSGHGCKYDAKATSVWYLPTFFEHGGELISDAEVMEVTIDRQGAGGAVKGVVYRKDGQVHRALASKVAVSCGTWGTPVLLARSGYGPRRILGAKTIVDNDNVGQNLDGDTNTGLEVMFDQPVKDGGVAGCAGAYWFVDDPQYSDGTGRMRMSESMSEIYYPHEAALSDFAPGWGKAHMDFMRTAISRVSSIRFGVTKPPTHVKGWVDLQTGAHHYPGDPYIDKRLNVGREIAIELAKKMGCKVSTKFPTTFKGRGGGHANGTCRAGSSRNNSVIDQNFESHEIKGLFIADASSYPRAISSNCGLVAAIMGAFAARRIVRNHFSRGV
jgi:choline dehydrogenase-like flavoprotein